MHCKRTKKYEKLTTEIGQLNIKISQLIIQFLNNEIYGIRRGQCNHKEGRGREWFHFADGQKSGKVSRDSQTNDQVQTVPVYKQSYPVLDEIFQRTR